MMANNKWTKWIVGLSGAVLFSGFVGYLSNHGAAEMTSGGAGPSYSDDSSSNSLQDSFDSQSGSSSGDQSGSSAFGGGFGDNGGQGFMGGDSGQSNSGSAFGGRMRSHAS